VKQEIVSPLGSNGVKIRRVCSIAFLCDVQSFNIYVGWFANVGLESRRKTDRHGAYRSVRSLWTSRSSAYDAVKTNPDLAYNSE